MTQTTATAKLRFIPETGSARTVVNGTEISVMWMNGAGWKVQARKDGLTVHSTLVQHEHKAVEAFNALVAEAETAEVEQPAAQPAEVKPIPGNVGRTMRVSDPAHTVLALAVTDPDGIVRQGGGLGYATRTQIRSLAKRGYLTEIYETGRNDARLVIAAGRITDKGRRRLAEITKADAEAARIADAIARTAA